MATADQLLEKIYSWIEKRERCAEQLRKLARELESLREKCNGSECFGSSVTVAGAACVLGAGVATLFTGGAAAPFLLTLGGMYTGVGVTICVATKILEGFKSSSTMKEAQEIEKNSDDIGKQIQRLFEKLKAETKEVSSSTDPDELDQRIITHILGAVARRSGVRGNINALEDDLRGFFGGSHGQTFNTRNDVFRLLKPEMMAVFVGILAFFTFQANGKKTSLLVGQAVQQLIKQMSTTGFKTFLKGGTLVVGGAVGMVFALKEAIDNWETLIKKDHVTDASKSLRDTADSILKMTRTLKEQLHSIQAVFERLARVQQAVENPNRSPDQKKLIIDFAIEKCEDEAVKQWLRQHSVIFFLLVDMFRCLVKSIVKIDIIFVAHGCIENPMIPASGLLPLPSITDVLLYSPWNCAINANAAYGVATGRIQPGHRQFYRDGKYCSAPDNLPDRWNSMKRAGYQMIPNIMLGPVKPPGDKAWNAYLELVAKHGEPERNRVVIPFIVPAMFHSLNVPFNIIIFVLSLVLFVFRIEATVHLAACLSRRTGLNAEQLKQQYAYYTIDKTGMTWPPDKFVKGESFEDELLFRALKAVFS